ncbi:UNVERIFIED_CONTAM: hypothetical protein Sradi_2981200 [Sesamum radiatum]|uniref:Uncharacterized protein n=1 Tax=Sesamum radiatum TaxID=300843 RepID=A0AAW2S0G6_SESRA
MPRDELEHCTSTSSWTTTWSRVPARGTELAAPREAVPRARANSSWSQCAASCSTHSAQLGLEALVASSSPRSHPLPCVKLNLEEANNIASVGS